MADTLRSLEVRCIIDSFSTCEETHHRHNPYPMLCMSAETVTMLCHSERRFAKVT